MSKNLIAQVSIVVNASREKTWNALVDPESIKQYMFNTTVVSDWHESSPIIWKGEWQGKSYEDKGVILQLKPERIIQYSHYSPLSGLPDKPENYHTVTIELSEENDQTRITLTQDKNATEEERIESENNWKMMLASLKRLLEK